MPKLTLAQRMDALEAENAALRAQLTVSQAPVTPTFATATNGIVFACTAENPCARTDMKTAKGAAVHNPAAGESGHTPRDLKEIARIAAKKAPKAA